MVLDLIVYSVSSKIKTRKDIDTWRERCRARKKLYIRGYFIGVLILGGLVLLISINATPSRGTRATTAAETIISFLTAGFCCGGPIVLFICWFLFSGGMREYGRLITRLESNGRVCAVCDAVALYEDKWIEASKPKRHTQADLIPHMNVIQEDDGKRHVLCDRCHAEVNAIGSDQ